LIKVVVLKLVLAKNDGVKFMAMQNLSKINEQQRNQSFALCVVNSGEILLAALHIVDFTKT
jgi:hypothetical protein